MTISQELVIIDYGMGNLHSVHKKCKLLGVNSVITSDPDIISKAKRIILPGVGHFKNAMNKIHERDLFDVLNQKVILEGIPILGICLGMQLFTNFSEEGNANGFGWVDANVKHFKFDDIRLKVPHMGWNSIAVLKNSKIAKNINLNHLYYFVHSYYVECNNSTDALTSTVYGHEFVSAFEKDNILGMQFHPEKSHEWGEQLISNFLKI